MRKGYTTPSAFGQENGKETVELKLQRTIRSINRKLYARLRYTDSDGNRRELLRVATTKTEAKSKLAELEVEIKAKGTKHLEAGKVTFRQLG